MSQYFPKLFRSFGGNINVKVDLSNYATKTDLKNVTHVDTSSFALKTNLANLKTEVDKLDIDKLAPVPADLSKLSDVVKNDVKKAVCDKLAAKVNNIDTSGFVLKTKYQTGKTELEKKIPDVTNFLQKTKLTELANKIPDVSSLATKTALTAVKIKIPSVSSLVIKTDYDTKISKLEKKLTITAPEFDTLAANVFNARLVQANLITKTDFDIKVSSTDSTIAANTSKNKSIENKLQELKKYLEKSDLNILDFLVTIYPFDSEDGTQAYSIFQPVDRYFKRIANTKHIAEQKSKGLSDESIKSITTSDNSLAPLISYYGSKIKLKFNGTILRQSKVTYTHKKAVNIYIV